MPFNTLLWRATALQGDQRVEIVTGFLDGDTPLNLEYFPRRTDLQEAVSELPEAQRLEWFTRGFLDYDQLVTALWPPTSGWEFPARTPLPLFWQPGMAAVSTRRQASGLPDPM